PRLVRYAASGSRSAPAGSATAARWMTPAGATSATNRASHEASHTSPAWSLRGRPATRAASGGRRASPCTSCPPSTRARATTGPANPDTPVTRTRITSRPAAQAFEIGTHHELDQRAESHAGRPAEHTARLRGVPDQVIDLGRAEQRGVLTHPTARVDPDDAERDLDQVAHRVRLPGRHHVIVGDRLLEHAPHRLDVVAGEAPVAACVEGADHELRRLAERDPGEALRHFPGHELATAARALVIEEDPRAGEQAIALTVVDRDVVAVDLRDPVRAAGMKRRRLALRRLRRLPEHLARAGLIEA